MVVQECVFTHTVQCGRMALNRAINGARTTQPYKVPPGPKWARTQIGPGPNGPRPKWARAQMGPGPNGPRPKWDRAQMGHIHDSSWLRTMLPYNVVFCIAVQCCRTMLRTMLPYNVVQCCRTKTVQPRTRMFFT